MHETAVAQGLIDTILQEADKQGGKPTRAKMSCGLLNAVNDDVLRFAFEALAEGTVCEGTILEIEHRPMQARCKACDGTFSIKLSEARCPHCAADDFELLPDAPLMLDEIEFEKE
jgi:hydrogenase nickel incorporation protein HypA/HybF